MANPAREPLPPRLPADLAATDIDDLGEGLEGVRARDVRLAGAKLGRLGLLDCALSRCDLAGLDATSSSLARVELAECRLLARGNRLSVMPIEDDEFDAIVAYSRKKKRRSR